MSKVKSNIQTLPNILKKRHVILNYKKLEFCLFRKYFIFYIFFKILNSFIHI